jgi:leucyl-tRNA synthetase
VVEKREIPGYYLNITQYAQELLDGVSMANAFEKAAGVNSAATATVLEDWPVRVRLMQENWIGKSEGVRFAFPHAIKDAAGELIQDGKMYVFTTRADTIMGVTFVAVAPEHPLAVHAAASNPSLAAFIAECAEGGTTEAELATQEKKGERTGLMVTHPLTGEQVEVWVGNYVLMSYGDGAVMGVPAHDERDFAFANKYGIAIKQVIAHQIPNEVDASLPQGVWEHALSQSHPFDAAQWNEWYGTKNGKCIHSDALDGLGFKQAVSKVAELLSAKGLGEKKTTWRLRDWGVSRQRYWGTPIPIIHCEEHGAVPVPEQDLPVVLPKDCVPDGSGNPLHKHVKFHEGVTCPTCGKPARRETDTMDTFVDSSWYYMRYCDPKNDGAMVAGGAAYWMQGGMDQYIGGIEHAILHLLYARFWTKVMRDLGLVTVDEPFKKLLCQGMVLNHVYSRKTAKGAIEYFWPHDVDNTFAADGRVNGATLKSDGSAVDYGGVTTMSKSKNNGVDPQDIIDRYGADTARLYMMFTAPPEATLEWNDSAVEGSFRYLRRVWNFAVKHQVAIAATMQAGCGNAVKYTAAGKALRFEMYSLYKQANFDYERMQYNTVVSAGMKMLNVLEAAELSASYDDRAVLTECTSLLLCTLYPVCPHITTELWQTLGYAGATGQLLDAPWPTVDEAALIKDELELMLQINGKLRGSMTVPASADKAAIEAAALASEAFLKAADGATAKKVIVVPGRLVNVVV